MWRKFPVKGIIFVSVLAMVLGACSPVVVPTALPVPTQTSVATQQNIISVTATSVPTTRGYVVNTPTPQATHVQVVTQTVMATATQKSVIPVSGLPLGGGVSLSSTEWYQPGWKLEPPLSVINTLKSWGATYIRIPVNQRTWLNKEEYRNYIDGYVQETLKQGMYAIVDLHWSDQGNNALPDDKVKQQKMPDANSLKFWQQVAAKYKDQPQVLFEIYNEPHDVSANVWENGGTVDGYQAVGMQTLVDAVRKISTDNWLIVNGLDYGYSWQGLAITGTKIYKGIHIYALKEYHHKETAEAWQQNIGTFLKDGDPVFISEFGDLENCDGKFYQIVIDYATQNHIPWIAWAAYPAKDACGYPALLTDWNGNTTPAGTVVKQNLHK